MALMHNMSSTSFLDLLLLVLLVPLPQASGEEAEPLFRVEGSTIELGYCFGVDYIVVYRSGPEGDQLLGNSSAEHAPIATPADLQGRIRINNEHNLLGLQISDLTHMDSGTYRRECWRSHKRASQHTQQLSVCDEEVSSVEIIKGQEGERTELLCNHTSSGMEGTTVQWFREKFPSYKMTLFLDSSVSLQVLLEELQGLVEVRERGTLLLLDNVVLDTNHHFYCMVMSGQTCLTFQNMFLPDRSESKVVFSSRGDRVVFYCPAEGSNQLWETPLGQINENSANNELMFLRFGEKSKDFSLVIPKASEEHSGDYSCVSSTLEVQYLLVLCPKQETQEHVFVEGRNVSMGCNASTERVRWYRLDPSGQHQLIHDSDDIMIPIPKDLMDRMILSENGSSLTITDLEKRHEGVYWCVVLEGAEVFLEEEEGEGGEDYDLDYTDGDGGEDGDDFIQDPDWPGTNSCILKQETRLLFKRPSSRVPDSPGGTPTSEPAEGSNETTYAVVGVVVALLVLGGAAAGIVILRRKKRSQGQSEVAALSEHNTTDTNLKRDPGCTDPMLPPPP